MPTNGLTVILADQRDGHLPYVTPHLDSFVVVDTARILRQDHLTYRTTKWGTEVVYKGEPLRDVRSVWFRNMSSERIIEAHDVAQQVRKTLGETTTATAALHKLTHDLIGDPEQPYWARGIPVAETMQAYAASSLNRLAGAFVEMFPNARWVSPRSSLAAAMHKPAQIERAYRHGLRVPETVITSDPDEAGAFLRRLGRCVIKPLALNAPAGLNQYTTILTAADEINFSGLWANPQIFQEVLDPAYEVRVTVVGNKVFAAEVADARPPVEGRIRDWRTAFEHDSFRGTAIKLPRDIKAACLAMIGSYTGLRTGMYDFIVDKLGRWYFLEINPNGAWGFIEDATGYPIGKAFAAQLRGR